MAYEVYATRWNDGHVVEGLVPARGLEFTMPLSDHGEASFTATVEPGRSFWRPALSAAMSGILICRDSVPVWLGRMLPEDQSGPREFTFHFAEWGSFFEEVPPAMPVDGSGNALPLNYVSQNNQTVFCDLIYRAQQVDGQNVDIILPSSTTGGVNTNLTINPWDDTTVEAEFRRLGEAGPEWYFGTSGTFENPTRPLMLGDRLGSTIPTATLEYVEATVNYEAPAAPPVLTSLGNVFPGQQPQAVLKAAGRRGGNVIAHPARHQAPGYTRVVAIGAGSQASQLRATATATDLLAAGYPLRTKTTQYPDVEDPNALARHADADLAACRGMVTTYTFTTFEDDPDWTLVQRGDAVHVVLDTDVYAGARPTEFTTRVLDLAVHVPDQGRTQVNWTVADVQEV